MNSDIDILLAKYFGGEASADDLRLLDDWLAASTENEDYFFELTTLYEKAATVPASPKPQVTEALNEFEKYITQSDKTNKTNEPATDKPIPKIRVLLYRQIAAIFVVFIAVSLFFVLRNTNNKIELLAATDLVFYSLPDNTEIQLSPNSIIRYDKDYGNGAKNIELTGKALFDVKDDAGTGKMIVKAGETYIEDIGTVFTVDAYTDSEDVTVSVESGKVLFYTLHQQGLELTAGEKGRFHRIGKTFEKITAPPISITPAIVFDATPLPEAIDILSDRYGKMIKLGDNSLKSRQITVSFADNENFDKILHIIAETLLLDINYTDGIFWLTPR